MSTQTTETESPSEATSDEAPITTTSRATKNTAPPLVLRALLGFAGLSLLIGFFLPWVRIRPDGPPSSGLDLLFQPDVGGTPSMGMLLLPVLGVVLAVLSFMGFRFAAHTAIGIAVVLVLYAVYVLFQLFVAHTAVGLWIVAFSIVLTLLFGIGAILWARRAQPTKG